MIGTRAMARESGGASRGTERPGVVLVDDDAAVREFLREALLRAGYEVFPCASGAQALEVIREGQARAAILDLRMPGLGGIETLAQIREMAPAVQAIVLTGFGDLGTARRAMELGAFDYLTKPLDIEFLYRTLRDATRPREARK